MEHDDSAIGETLPPSALADGTATLDATRGDRAEDGREAMTLGASDARSSAGRRSDAMPSKLGRFEVRRRLGAGGMGVVFEAYDPRLDRPVALKLLLGEGRAEHRTRLRREAQAMAQLSHPNVVQIFEVGEEGGHSFIAMELIDGVPLDRWLDQTRSSSEILGVFIQAGRGLAAAHEMGLVHRDFKPSNVLVGTDGRARVLDFGLVQSVGMSDGSGFDDRTNGDSGGESVWDSELTQHGALMGTPAYMSPEQYGGEFVTAHSDQFGYCVALYEALWGQHPFSDSSQWPQLARAIMEGRPRTVPRERALPRGAESVVVRGLAREPSDRWPSMTELIERLEGLSGGTRRRTAARVGLGAVVLAVGIAYGLGGFSSRPAQCQDVEGRLREVWSDEHRGRIERALSEANPSFGPRAWQQVEPVLDHYAEQWVSAVERACVLSPDDPRFERRMGCMEHRRRALSTRGDLLASVDETTVARAADVVAELPSIAECEESELAPQFEQQTEEHQQRNAIDALYVEFDAIRALEANGQYERALERANAAVRQAETLDFAPARIEAEYLQGCMYWRIGEFTPAAEVLEHAYFEAKQDPQSRLAHHIAERLLTVHAELDDYDTAKQWGQHMRTELERIGSDDFSDYHSSLGVLEARFDNLEAASWHQERTLELLEGREARKDRALFAITLSNLGMVRRRQERTDDALALYERALAEQEANLGTGHPDLAFILNNMSIALYHLNRLPEAEDAARRAVEIRRAALPSGSPTTAIAVSTLVAIISGRGRHDDAIALCRGALEELREDPSTRGARATVLTRLGRALLSAERVMEAEPPLREALSIAIELHGTKSLIVSHALEPLADCHQAQGAYAKEVELRRRVVAIVEAAKPNDIESQAETRINLAKSLFNAGQLTDAVSEAERSTGPRVGSKNRARALFVMADAQWSLGETERGKASARDAIEVLGTTEPTLRARIEAWLQSRPSESL